MKLALSLVSSMKGKNHFEKAKFKITNVLKKALHIKLYFDIYNCLYIEPRKRRNSQLYNEKYMKIE